MRTDSLNRAGIRAVWITAFVMSTAGGAAAQCELAKLQKGMPQSHADFGHSVSISGDTIVAGEPGSYLAQGSSAGAAYVFVNAGDSWTKQKKLKASDAHLLAEFGTSVSICGDTVVVGSPRADWISAGEEHGAAYVFARTGTTWTERVKLEAQALVPEGHLGHSVAIDGDTIVAGAPESGPSGAAVVFARTGPTWAVQQVLHASDGHATDDFGHAVAIDGDLLVVGAPRALGSGGFVWGATYIFARSGTTWAEVQKIQGPGAGYFGRTVDVSGDTVATGAPFEGAGVAYAFVDTPSGWAQQARITVADADSQAQLGSSVDIRGDTLAIGAVWEGGWPNRHGRVYTFRRSGTAWSEAARVTANDGAHGDRFGESVALGPGIVVSGAPSHDGPYDDVGAAYVVALPGSSASYCVSTANSSGGAAVIRAYGCASVAGTNFSVRVSPVPETPGVFVYGATPVQVPFGNGYRCVSGTLHRSPFLSGAGGAFNWVPDLSQPPHDRITPGSTWHFQAWFRDAAAGGSLFDLSDAVSVTFEP